MASASLFKLLFLILAARWSVVVVVTRTVCSLVHYVVTPHTDRNVERRF